MSPGASHAATAMQVPALQFVEQQSVPTVQESPSVLQVEPLEPGGSGAHFDPKPQMPEQHCVSLAQDWFSWRHTLDEQVAPALPAFGQLCEQHCASDPQVSPGYAHIPPSSTHFCVAVSHAPEQHWPSALHASPGSKQVGTAGVSQWPALQYPEQQSRFSMHASVSSWQMVVGFVQMPPSHEPEQQSSGPVHERPLTLHPPSGSMHVPLHPDAAPLASGQQSPGVAQGSPCGRHWFAEATHVPAVSPGGIEQVPEQQSPFTVHAPSSGASVQPGVVVPLDFLQPDVPSASAARAHTRSVESFDVDMAILPRPGDGAGACWTGSVPRIRHAFHVVAGGFFAACESRRRGTEP